MLFLTPSYFRYVFLLGNFCESDVWQTLLFPRPPHPSRTVRSPPPAPPGRKISRCRPIKAQWFINRDDARHTRKILYKRNAMCTDCVQGDFLSITFTPVFRRSLFYGRRANYFESQFSSNRFV